MVLETNYIIRMRRQKAFPLVFILQHFEKMMLFTRFKINSTEWLQMHKKRHVSKGHVYFMILCKMVKILSEGIHKRTTGHALRSIRARTGQLVGEEE